MGIISFKKGGGEPLWKRGGGTDPLFPPPPLNPPLMWRGEVFAISDCLVWNEMGDIFWDHTFQEEGNVIPT